jgi:hypothetical protein
MYTWPIAAARVSHNSSETNAGGAVSPNKNGAGAPQLRVDPDFVARPASGGTTSSVRSEEPANVASKDLPKPPPLPRCPRPLQEDSLKKSPPVSAKKVSLPPPPSLSAVLLCHLIDCSPEEQEAVVEGELPDLVAPYSQTTEGSTSTTTTTFTTDDETTLEEETTTTTSTSTRTDLSSETTLEETAKKPALRRRRGGGGRSSNTVSFGNAHIREFPVVIGDNPSVLFGGPPLRLGYDEASGGSEEDAEYIVSVDDYEKRRAPHRRPATQLRVPPNVRREWVGYHPELERQVYYQQRARIHSVASAEHDEWNYLLECAVRGLTKRVRRLGLSHNSHPQHQQQQPATNEASAHEWIRLHKQAKQRMLEYQKLQEQERLQERQQQRLRHVAQEKQRSPKNME